MQNIKYEVEVHGIAVQADKNLDITRQDDCASITLRNGERQLRFPVSTPTVVSGQRLKAGKFYMRFTTYDSSRIYFVKITDGDKRLVLQTDLPNWRGKLIERSFEFPGAPIDVEWGLNVTVGVDSDTAPARVDIIGLGVVLY
ncbi:hypothetical protein N7471_009141 [Penicillium samsonianum]|uniref:uncharacterized protein n=1 Tax=Penicillium samsonianum TaxID=1882272 RepID=UPI0025492963|nr:uncharacterized protein N7471_009141 [Penicillium samsonianum]KAJ6127924.1 hypothetical protein N7471_009141 [Penicillium samsonianum]